MVLAAAFALNGCGLQTTPLNSNDYLPPDLGQHTEDSKRYDTVFGDEGGILGLGKNNKPDSGSGTGTGIGVNAFLWRATLDTLSFMPLASADPFGGVIITEWYQPPTGGNERFKATAYILGRELRADAVKVNIFRQVLQNGQWQDATVAPSTATEIEDKVLSRARDLRAHVVAGN